MSSGRVLTLLTVLFLLITLPSFTYASESISKQLTSKKITLKVENASLKEILYSIQKESNINFIFEDKKAIQSNERYSYEFESETVSNILNSIFRTTNYAYHITKNGVAIYSRNEPQQNKQDEKWVTINGKVIDDDGKAVVGATVVVLNSNGQGAITDGDGGFKLYLPNYTEIEVSFVGMKTVKKVIDTHLSEMKLVVKLQLDELQVEDVVVTGYETTTNKRYTGARTSVSADEVLVPGMTSIDQALEGRIPDLVFTNNSGEVGSTGRIRVRGTSTLLGNREPLWVLDGFILTDPVDVSNDDLNNPDYINIVGNAIMGINPQDIERIDVLKDAAATALYGVRAANGVIVVTTKKGSIQKPRVSYNHSSKITRRPRYTDNNIELMNSQERVQFGMDLTKIHYQFPSNMPLVGYEGAYYRLNTGQINYDDFLTEVKQYEVANTDWFDELTQDTYSQDHTVSLSGGTEEVRYYVSVGYNNEIGVSKTTYNNRFTTRANIDMNLSEKLMTSFSLSGNILGKNNLMSEINAMDYAYNTTRTLPSHNPDGTLYYYDKIAYGGFNVGYNAFDYNIINEIENSSSSYDGSTLSASLNLKYKIIQELDITFAGQYTYSGTTQEEWWGENSNYMSRMRNTEMGVMPEGGEAGSSMVPYGGILGLSNSNSNNYTIRIQYDFRKSFGEEDKHSIFSTGGFEMNSATSKSYSSTSYGYLKERGLQYVSDLDLEMYPHYADLINESNRSNSYGISNMMSRYATIGYNYNNHFNIYANGRLDASNKFGQFSNDRILPIWAISFSWNIDENLAKDVEWITSLILRSSYGSQGNMLDSQSPNLIISQGSINPYYGEYESTIARYPNPNLAWETTLQQNYSIDASLFDGMINLHFSYFDKLTRDVFSEVAVSTVNGVPNHTYVMNDGNITNQGFSASVSARVINTQDLKLNLSANVSVINNTLRSTIKETYAYTDYLSGLAPVNGRPLSTFYSYDYLGLNPVDGAPLFDDYIDAQHLLNGKSIEEIIQMTMVESGQRDATCTGSFSANLTYKQFSFMSHFSYSLGGKVRLFPLYGPILTGVSAENNVRVEFLDRWMAPGDEAYTDVPVILSPADPAFLNYLSHYSAGIYTDVTKFAENVWSMYDNSDLRVVSGNYLKCTSMSVRYRFTNAQLAKMPFSSLYVSLNAMNMFTISAKELNGQDPSQAGFAMPNLSLRPSYTLQFNFSF